jgi:hypothetical protein
VKRSRYPQFKSKRKSRAAAAFASNAFRFKDGQLWLAKMTEPLDVRWSRPLPGGAELLHSAYLLRGSEEAAGEVLAPSSPPRGEAM